MATTMGVMRNAKSPKTKSGTWEALENTMSRLEFTATSLKNGNFDDILLLNLCILSHSLPNYGHIIEEAYQVPLDRAFKIFRNACQDENLDVHCRLNLISLIERRAMDWKKTEDYDNYYKNKIPSPEGEPQPVRVDQFQGAHSPLPSTLPPTVPLLGPGEQIKSSGRFPQPTRIQGKNYFKDEVVINNSDSGKVMGIKGRRVHMIEELSETIISFQRVTPGVKERLVQITGPNETRINEAIHLMGDTIRRNASPVPFRVDQPDLGSSSSVNSSASEESNRIQTGHPQSNHRLQHSFSTNDASPEYKHTVKVGAHIIKLTGTNYDLVSESKILLERHFEDRNLRSQLDVPLHLTNPLLTPEPNVDAIHDWKQRVVRQPLFPEAPKSAFEQVEASGRPDSLSARHRRAYFEQTNLEKDKILPPPPPAPKKYLRYSREMIYALAGSKMSTAEPDNWDAVCPAILNRDKPVEVFDPVTYCKKYLETDSSASILSASDTDTVDVE